MSNMTTLEKVYDRVNSMARFHEDRLIPINDVSFADLERVCISGATYNMRPIAQQSICWRLGIPSNYLRKCPPDIQQKNLNYWIRHEKNEKLFFRFDQGEVRAIRSLTRLLSRRLRRKRNPGLGRKKRRRRKKHVQHDDP